MRHAGADMSPNMSVPTTKPSRSPFVTTAAGVAALLLVVIAPTPSSRSLWCT